MGLPRDAYRAAVMEEIRKDRDLKNKSLEPDFTPPRSPLEIPQYRFTKADMEPIPGLEGKHVGIEEVDAIYGELPPEEKTAAPTPRPGTSVKPPDPTLLESLKEGPSLLMNPPKPPSVEDRKMMSKGLKSVVENLEDINKRTMDKNVSRFTKEGQKIPVSKLDEEEFSEGLFEGGRKEAQDYRNPEKEPNKRNSELAEMLNSESESKDKIDWRGPQNEKYDGDEKLDKIIEGNIERMEATDEELQDILNILGELVNRNSVTGQEWFWYHYLLRQGRFKEPTIWMYDEPDPKLRDKWKEQKRDYKFYREFWSKRGNKSVPPYSEEETDPLQKNPDWRGPKNEKYDDLEGLDPRQMV